MAKMTSEKMVKRLNTTLPDPLAIYVGAVTGKGALYETPSEFIRDLVRRHMESAIEREHSAIHALLTQSLNENAYAAWSEDDLEEARAIASK